MGGLSFNSDFNLFIFCRKLGRWLVGVVWPIRVFLGFVLYFYLTKPLSRQRVHVDARYVDKPLGLSGYGKSIYEQELHLYEVLGVGKRSKL